jgi:hypothetical protein
MRGGDRPEPARFVFLVGTGRCGSSLVQEVLSRHPDVGFVSNLEDRLGMGPAAGRWNGVLYRRVPQWFTVKGRLRYAPSEGYRLLEREVSPLVSTPFRDLQANDATPWLAGRFRSFFEQRARAQGKPVFLHKFTGWPRASFIDRILPEARFVHVVRDGRAVASSLVQMPWWQGYRGPAEWGWGPLSDADERAWRESGRSFALLAGLEWKLLMDAFERARRAVPDDRWHEVRYEDFVADPKGRVKELLSFMGLEWTEGFERGFRRHMFRADRTDAYLRDLAPADVVALERSLGRHLARLGYASGPAR